MNKKILAFSVVSILALGSSCPTFAASKVVQTSEHSGTAALYIGIADPWEDHVESVDNGAGKWKYGHRPSATLNKYVYSDLDHKTKKHKSWCKVDTNESDSGVVPPMETSRANVVGPRDSTAYVQWSSDCE